MLLAIREKVTGAVALAFVAIIALLMVVPMLYDYVVGLGTQDALEVAGEKVGIHEYNQRLSATRQRLMSAFGEHVPESVDVDALVKQQTIEAIVNERVLNAATIEDGFRLGNADVERLIIQDPTFMENGKFNQELYERQITNAGYTHNYYKQVFGQQAAQQQLVNGVINTAFATDAELHAIYALQNQQRDVDVIQFKADDYRSQVSVSDAQIAAYYEENKQNFIVPEQITVDYISLNIKDFKDKVNVTEEEINSEYQSGIAAMRYATPELRSASHILISLPEDADSQADAKALQEAEDIYQQLKNGADFAELAKKYSADDASGARGGSLGEVPRGVMVPSFENAVYSQAAGDIGKPFKSPFGYHIVRVDNIIPAKEKSLASVHDEIKNTLIDHRARANYDEALSEIANLSDENPDDLKPVAQALNLSLQTSPRFSRDQGEGIFANTDVRNLAFSDAILAESHNSEVFAINENQSVILRLNTQFDSHPKSLEEASAEVKAALLLQETQKRIQAQVAKVQQQLQDGQKLAEVAAALSLPVQHYPQLSRAQTGDLSPTVVSAIFAANHPQEGKATIGSAQSGADSVLFALNQVRDGGDAADFAKERDAYRNLLSGSNGMADFSAMLADLRSQAKIWVSPQIDTISEH